MNRYIQSIQKTLLQKKKAQIKQKCALIALGHIHDMFFTKTRTSFFQKQKIVIALSNLHLSDYITLTTINIYAEDEIKLQNYQVDDDGRAVR